MSTRGRFGCPGGRSNGCYGRRRPPSGASYYLQRAQFESFAERKLRRRQLTEDGNVEIGGRDLQ